MHTHVLSSSMHKIVNRELEKFRRGLRSLKRERGTIVARNFFRETLIKMRLCDRILTEQNCVRFLPLSPLRISYVRNISEDISSYSPDCVLRCAMNASLDIILLGSQDLSRSESIYRNIRLQFANERANYSPEYDGP